MARSAASYGAAVLHTPSGVLHKSAFSDEALLCFTAQYEASPLRSDMKHSLRSYDEKMENESSSVCNTTMSVLYYHQEGITHHGKIFK